MMPATTIVRSLWVFTDGVSVGTPGRRCHCRRRANLKSAANPGVLARAFDASGAISTHAATITDGIEAEIAMLAAARLCRPSVGRNRPMRPPRDALRSDEVRAAILPDASL